MSKSNMLMLFEVNASGRRVSGRRSYGITLNNCTDINSALTSTAPEHIVFMHCSLVLRGCYDSGEVCTLYSGGVCGGFRSERSRKHNGCGCRSGGSCSRKCGNRGEKH